MLCPLILLPNPFIRGWTRQLAFISLRVEEMGHPSFRERLLTKAMNALPALIMQQHQGTIIARALILEFANLIWNDFESLGG